MEAHERIVDFDDLRHEKLICRAAISRVFCAEPVENSQAEESGDECVLGDGEQSVPVNTDILNVASVPGAHRIRVQERVRGCKLPTFLLSDLRRANLLTGNVLDQSSGESGEGSGSVLAVTAAAAEPNHPREIHLPVRAACRAAMLWQRNRKLSLGREQ